ncbi:MAG: glutamine synthetase family protein [Lachnospiraceae bacterium]
MMTKKDILEMVEQEDVEFIRLQFTDMFGNLRNVAVADSQLERVLENKYAFEGWALYGEFQSGDEDLYLYPDLDTFVILPWRPQQGKVARLLCDVCYEDGTPCSDSPRTILKNVLSEAKEKGYEFYVDPECEFFLFHSDEDGIPTTLTHEQAGYMDVGPIDMGENARRDMVMTLEDMGFEIESSHHEKAPAQHEIVFRGAEALTIADSIMTFRSAVRSIARRFGLHASFMPKPKKGVAGSGMHMNISVYKDGRNIFNSENREVRDELRWFMGGIMSHAKGLCAITNPLVNSYKRVNSGFGSPKDIAWSTKNLNSLLRIHTRPGEDTKVEIRFPDSAANPYLALATCIAAGIEGLEQHTNPGECYEVLQKQNAEIMQLPGTLREAIGEIEKDIVMQSVLGKEFLDTYVAAKTTEWNEYMEEVSDWEVKKYLNRV